MRDEQKRDPLRLQFAHADEEPLDLVAVELRGRLIEDDEAGAVRERAGDLHELARFDLEVSGAHVLRHQPSRSETGGAGSPEKRTSPTSGSRKPVRIPTSVDLPAPLRPTSACDSPGMTRMCASLSATVAP